MTDDQVHGTPQVPRCCADCQWFSWLRGNQGLCTVADPGRGQDYPQVFGGQRACEKFET